MDFKENVILAPYTTFGIGGPARYFAEINQAKDLNTIFDFINKNNFPWLALGGGSNILISDDGFEGVVLKINILGHDYLAKNDKVIVRVAAGEVLDRLIGQTIDVGYYGLENLSLVPGLAGGLAIQNVSAYGRQASDLITAVEVFDTQDRQFKNISAADCNFAYRSSLFNNQARGRYIVTAVRLVLDREARTNIDYPDLKKYFSESGVEPTPENVRNAVIAIRHSKLPDPAKVGNAGSFFKNILVNQSEFKRIIEDSKKLWGQEFAQRLEDFGLRFATAQEFKLPTAMFIEAMGYKGLCWGGTQIHPEHALIITNPKGRATAEEVMQLANKIRSELMLKLGVSLIIEPELIGRHAEA